MTAPGRIIFDGEELVLHYLPGQANFLLVTFIGSHREKYATQEFLLQDFALRNEIPCLGITCKVRNFYLSDEIDAILSAAGNILKTSRPIVLVGNSMGGYAALKYSRRFGATHVLAVSPAYSLNHEDLTFANDFQRAGLVDDIEHNAVLLPRGFAGMAVRPEDVSGRLLVVYNSRNSIDKIQVQHLKQAVTVDIVPMLHAEHDIFPVLAHANTMSRILHALQAPQAAEAIREFHLLKRSSIKCLEPMLAEAVRKHPILVRNALRGKAVGPNFEIGTLLGSKLSSIVAYSLAARGCKLEAYEQFQTFLTQIVGRQVAELACGDTNELVGVALNGSCVLLSFHGTYLCFDSDRQDLAFSANPFKTRALEPVFCTMTDTLAEFHVRRHGKEHPVGIVVSGTRMAASWMWRGDRIVLRTDTGFVSSLPVGTVKYSAARINEWEHFVVFPIAEPDMLVRSDERIWLPKVPQERQAADIAPPAAKFGIGGGKWKKWFNRGH